jgi:L-lactate dehydrogenase complex protein LldG
MPGISRENFLDNIRLILGKPSPSLRPEYLPLRIRRENQRQRAVTIEARVQARKAELIDRLVSTATNQGWYVNRALSREDVVDYVLALARDKGAGLIVRSNHQVFKQVELDLPLREQGARIITIAKGRNVRDGDLREEMARADLGITGVDYAIAETGTCVLVPRPGVSRLVSLLPPIHVAIVQLDQVYETLDDLFALRRLSFMYGRGNMGSYMSFISGPSRTGDIEQTIVVGVHGPVEVHMLIMDFY